MDCPVIRPIGVFKDALDERHSPDLVIRHIGALKVNINRQGRY